MSVSEEDGWRDIEQARSKEEINVSEQLSLSTWKRFTSKRRKDQLGQSLLSITNSREK